MKVLSHRSLFFLLIIFSVFSLLACSDSEEPATGDVVEIEVTPSSLIVSGLDSSYELSLTGKLTNGQQSSDLSGVVWSSSNESLATVDNSGKVTIHALGKVNIYANYFGLVDEVNLEIVEISSLTVLPEKLEVTALDQAFSLNVIAKDDQDRQVQALGGFSWETSNNAIASVSTAGEITVHAVGSVSISVGYDNTSASSQLSINESGKVITGTASYTDRLYTTAGFSGVETRPIRFASVELLDVNGGVLASTSTDKNGAYQLGNLIPDQYYVRLLAEVKGQPAPGFGVKDFQGSIYSFTKSSVENNYQYAFELDQNLSATAVFNLLDVVSTAAQYSKQVLTLDVSDLQVYWEEDNNLSSTYYCVEYDPYDCQNGKGIYILSQSASFFNDYTPDTDEYDDDVILHEFAHFITENYAADDSEGGVHFINSNDSDLRLSWSEGLGTFFPSAVKFWLQTENPDLISSRAAVTAYIDTIGSGSYDSYDIATSELDDSFYYASSEAAVSRILWHLLQNFGMPKIWDVLVNYFPVSSRPTSLPVFWDGLLASDRFSAGELPLLESIFAERRVIYQLDDSEADNVPEDATVQIVGEVPTVTNTIYSGDGTADIDFIAFQAEAGKSYKISTIELYNGIDTVIRLFNAQGKVIAENDDADLINNVNNSRTAMASEIKFTASDTAQYFVEVKFADKKSSAYDFVGHYGSYKLVIVEQ